MAVISRPINRYWRTDLKMGRNVYACVSNDPSLPSADDPLIGVMETSEVAEDIVNTHNGALTQYGRRYPKMLSDAGQDRNVRPGMIPLALTDGERRKLLVLTNWIHSLSDSERKSLLVLADWVKQFQVPDNDTRQAIAKVNRALGGSE